MKFDRKYARNLLKRLKRLKKTEKRDSLINRLENLLTSAENNGRDIYAFGESEDYLAMY